MESITRDRLVKALEVEEGAWPVADLRAASEAFLASTTREIQAVAAIDGVELAEAPGPANPRGPGGIRNDPWARASVRARPGQPPRGGADSAPGLGSLIHQDQDEKAGVNGLPAER